MNFSSSATDSMVFVVVVLLLVFYCFFVFFIGIMLVVHNRSMYVLFLCLMDLA